MTTTEHLLVNDAIYGVSCSCSYFGTYEALTRHLLDIGSSQGYGNGYSEGFDDGRRLGYSEGQVDIGSNEVRQEGYDSGYEIGYGDGQADATTIVKGELVAADDPQIKPGARVRLEFDGSNGVTAHEGVVCRAPDDLLIAAGWRVRSATRIYLLAEAPDPDDEVLEEIAVADQASFTYAGKLAALRAAGYDVVKVEEK